MHVDEPDGAAAALATRYETVRARVASAARRVGRDPARITVVAVSKTVPVDVIAQALAAGVTDIGENRAQELKQKQAVLGRRARWHFIGPLQTNKVNHVVGTTALVHSVDRFGLAEGIAQRASSIGVDQGILIEVNLAGEPSKHGVGPERVLSLVAELAALPGLDVRGLMAIPPLTRDAESSRGYFRVLRDLGEQVQQVLPGAGELSMGMTRDFETAIEEGATIVRIGEAIFGPRRMRAF